MKQWIKRYGIFFYTALLIILLVIVFFVYEIPETHERRNEKIFFKWTQAIFFSILLVDKLTTIYDRFIRHKLIQTEKTDKPAQQQPNPLSGTSL